MEEITLDEKISLVTSFAEIEDLSSIHYKILKYYSNDDDSILRSICAGQLKRFPYYQEALDLLIEMGKDEESLVRKCAYESLAIFYCEKSERCFRDAMINEMDEVARSFAILGWVSVLRNLNYDEDECLHFIQVQKNNEVAESCLLCINYGFYLMDENVEVKELLAYLESEDAQVRKSILTLLGDIEFDQDEKEEVRRAISELLPREVNVSAIRKAVKLLDELADVDVYSANTVMMK